MSSARPSSLIVATFAMLLAMTVFVNPRATFAQDADAGASVEGTSVDADWDSTGPALDVDAAAADKVLELPQVTCSKDDTSGTCAAAAANDGTDDDGQAINAPSPSAPPTLDDDTASSAAPTNDWGDADDYQNQQVDAVPYAVYPYPVAVAGTLNRPSNVPASAYVPMSSPITQAARPPLNPSPWMFSPSASTFGRPAGSPMMAFTFHH